jgi:predicted MFS family arabinose efflux permease
MQKTSGVEGPATRAPSTFSALRYPNYRLFWTAQGLAVMGMTMEFVALGWLVYVLTSSAFILGVTGLIQALPRIALTLFGGVAADRIDLRKLLIGVQGVSAAMYVALATLVVLDLVQVWHVWLLAFTLGALRAFDNPGRQAIVPLLVAREDIPSAVALGNLAFEVPRLVGPATAGVLIAAVGLGTTFYVAALGFTLSCLMYAIMRAPRATAQRSGSVLGDIAEGLRFIAKNELFAAFIGLVFFNSIFGMAFQVLMPIFAQDILGAGSQGFGFLQGAVGGGAIVGSLIAARLAREGHRGRRALAVAALFGLAVVGFAWSRSFGLSLGLMFLIGCTNAYYMITISTTLQLLVPNEYRGRVMGLWSLTYSLPPLGGMVAGWIAEQAGAPTAVCLGGILATAMAALVAIRLPRVRKLD